MRQFVTTTFVLLLELGQVRVPQHLKVRRRCQKRSSAHTHSGAGSAVGSPVQKTLPKPPPQAQFIHIPATKMNGLVQM